MKIPFKISAAAFLTSATILSSGVAAASTLNVVEMTDFTTFRGGPELGTLGLGINRISGSVSVQCSVGPFPNSCSAPVFSDFFDAFQVSLSSETRLVSASAEVSNFSTFGGLPNVRSILGSLIEIPADGSYDLFDPLFSGSELSFSIGLSNLPNNGSHSFDYSIVLETESISPVPVPASGALMAGVLFLAAFRRKMGSLSS